MHMDWWKGVGIASRRGKKPSLKFTPTHERLEERQLLSASPNVSDSLENRTADFIGPRDPNLSPVTLLVGPPAPAHAGNEISTTTSVVGPAAPSVGHGSGAHGGSPDITTDTPHDRGKIASPKGGKASATAKNAGFGSGAGHDFASSDPPKPMISIAGGGSIVEGARPN